MSAVLKFTDPNGDPVYFDLDDNVLVTVDHRALEAHTKITSTDSGQAFMVAESPEQVCSLLEGLQRAK